jgi:hypothetical protein
MFRIRQVISILLLFFAVLACSTLFPDLPKNTQLDVPEVARKDGECSDPRFKEAELAAYKALVQAQTDAANVLKDDIYKIEATYGRDKSKLNDDYQSDLNKCSDTDCTLKAKKTYDDWIEKAQQYHDDAIYIAQGKEQAAIEAAQAIYYAQVEKARQKYCSRAYKASGGIGEAQLSGVICGLEQPFTINVSTSFVDYSIEFTPSSSTGGTYTFQWAKDVITASGSGNYTVEGAETDSPRLSLRGDSTGTIPVGSVTEGGAVVIELVPLDTGECQQP